MPEPDYKVGDQVEYVGPAVWTDLIDPGPHFCLDLFPPEPPRRCVTHYEPHTVAMISGTHGDEYGREWCSLNWQKAPKGDETEVGQFMSHLMRDPVMFARYFWPGTVEPWQERVLRDLSEMDD